MTKLCKTDPAFPSVAPSLWLGLTKSEHIRLEILKSYIVAYPSASTNELMRAAFSLAEQFIKEHNNDHTV